MKYRFLVSNFEQLEMYQKFVGRISLRMGEFLTFLKENYAAEDLPRVVVLTDCVTATQLVSDIPLPGFTNDIRTVFCPELEV